MTSASLARSTAITAVAMSAALACASGAAARAGTPASAQAGAGAAASAVRPAVRVNQVGYPPASAKIAFVMLPRHVASVRFALEGAHGGVYLTGRSTADLGRWSPAYQAVYRLDFSGFRHPGTYRIAVTSPVAALSPAFLIASPGTLYHRLVLNSVRYFTSERDGANVPASVLSREPANLTDRRATVYASPRYDRNDNLLGTFRKIGGPVNVADGWFDAGGGYEKFAYTASYSDALMLVAARDLAGQYPALRPEADFGLRWIGRLWNPVRKVMYVQVGIGNGNASNTIEGDYNFWFLPQREDKLGAKPGDPAYYVEYRPVFEAAPPGKPVSPDLAGRFAADFALGAQLGAPTRPGQARRLLAEARGVYAMAQTSHVGAIVTTFPHDYYPGSQWKSDMLWGAAEIALADEALGARPGQLHRDLATAARWARAYIAQGHPVGGDTFNLHDTGAVAEAELLQALRHAPGAPVIAPVALLDDLATQLRIGAQRARSEPFGLGTTLGTSDASAHAFGLYVTNALYRRYGGPGTFGAFAQQQMNFALGANAWGSSFVVGAGSTFPHCMQSEIANLAGSLTGRGNIQLGAVTNGPSSPVNFRGLGTVPGMKACSAGDFKPFGNAVAGYEDNVVSWPSVEPADDYTAGSMLAFALGAGSAGA